MNSRELRDALSSLPEYQTKSPSTAARLIAQFTEMSVGDKVLICRGYPPNSDRPVQIFGIAKIDGEFFNDLSSTWWRFKRSATIQEINQQVPREIVSGALNKDSLMQTIHELSSEAFKRLEDVLAEDFE